MITKGIRDAITVDENSETSINEAVSILLNEMLLKNNIEIKNISHIIFTTSKDLNATFPAKFARHNLGFEKTAMMCFHELDVPNSLPMCLRVLIVLNCDENFEPKFVYLKDAAKLRD